MKVNSRQKVADALIRLNDSNGVARSASAGAGTLRIWEAKLKACGHRDSSGERAPEVGRLALRAITQKSQNDDGIREKSRRIA